MDNFSIKPVPVFFQTISSWLSSFFYPAKCLECGIYLPEDQKPEKSLESNFCPQCLNRTKNVVKICSPFCTKCGIPFPKSHLQNHVCGRCLSDPYTLEIVRAAAEYSGIIKEAIPLLKYNSKINLATGFEHLLFDSFVDYFFDSQIDIILPIPLHRKRLKERGFNQSYLMVRNFEKLFYLKTKKSPKWRIDTQTLVRKRNTPSQTGFDTTLRKKNVKNAFEVTDSEKIKDKSILLVDDVLTTGATCDEAARILIKNGARQVYGLVLARA